LIVWNYNEESPGTAFGAKDVNITYSTDNETWKSIGIVEFNEASGLSTYEANTFVDMNNAIAKYIRLTFLSSWDEAYYTGGISEIHFTVIPTRASNPDPANGATNIAIGKLLSWKAGREADDHKIYIGSDKNLVAEGTAEITATTEEPNYVPSLALSQTYYWRVDEVNEAEEYPIWDGPVWSFSTLDYVLIDGFETGYGDTSTDAVYKTWKDGVEQGNAANGSYMGRSSPPYLQTINHSGGHSAPMKYRNGSATYSEVTADTSKLAIGSDWTKGNPDTLEIWFRADANDVNESVTDQLYVKLNNANKMIYDGPASYIRRAAWTRWQVPLTGINLSNITSITIGAERIGAAGGTGIIYLDDIRLTIGVDAVDPGTEGLIAKYNMENNVQDSSGNGLNGTLKGTVNGGPAYVQGLTGYGTALVFDGNDDCVDLGNKEEFNPEGSFSVSLWAKIADWSTNWGHVMIGNRGEDNVGWQIRKYSNNRMCFTTRGVGDDDTYSNANPPALNEWINITCVYDSEAQTKSIYIDGALDRAVNLNSTVTKIAATTHNTYIGARATSDNTGQESFFTGMLDQILIYDRALSAGEAEFLADPTP
jgi:hypothetical protein